MGKQAFQLTSLVSSVTSIILGLWRSILHAWSDLQSITDKIHNHDYERNTVFVQGTSPNIFLR